MPEPTFIDRRVEIRSSSVHGKGMFANAPIRKGETVYRWGGNFFNSEEMKAIDPEGKVIIQVGEDLWSVEERSNPDDDTYYINHSCDSNVWMADGLTFIARKDISKDEELTVDYALFEDEAYLAKWSCNCGYARCRKRITGKDYLNPYVQAQYKGHFSPLINRKMR